MKAPLSAANLLFSCCAGGNLHINRLEMKLLSPFGGCLALLLFSLFSVGYAAEGEAEEEAVNVLLFMFFGIGVGVIFMQCLNLIGDPVPYTVVVFIAGILFSLSNKDGTGNRILKSLFLF